MTTGRINQVTTLAHEQTALRRRRRLLLGNRSNAENRLLARRSSSTTEASVRTIVAGGDSRTVAKNRLRVRALLSALRLPNTRCEVGILKTVEFVKELHATDSIFPRHVLVTPPRRLRCWTRATEVSRLAAGHLRRRQRGNRWRMNRGTRPCDLQKLLKSTHSAPAPLYKEKQLR
jgi:hypothetical protein